VQPGWAATFSGHDDDWGLAAVALPADRRVEPAQQRADTLVVEPSCSVIALATVPLAPSGSNPLNATRYRFLALVIHGMIRAEYCPWANALLPARASGRTASRRESPMRADESRSLGILTVYSKRNSFNAAHIALFSARE
jgi:hypothetical protein